MSTYEHILAKELGQPRELLKSIRLEALAPDEWTEEPGKGIALSESGVKKIRGALGLPADAGPVRADLVVVKLHANPRVVDAEGDGVGTVRVRIVNYQPFPVRKNTRLPGCVLDAEAAIWNFHGRAPRA